MQNFSADRVRLIHALDHAHTGRDQSDGDGVGVFGIRHGAAHGIVDRVRDGAVVGNGIVRFGIIGKNGVFDGHASARRQIGKREARGQVVRRLRHAVDCHAARDVSCARSHDVFEDQCGKIRRTVVRDDDFLPRRFAFVQKGFIRTLDFGYRRREHFRLHDVAVLFAALRGLVGQNVIERYVGLVEYDHLYFFSYGLIWT